MIILLVSAAEAEDLMRGRPDRGVIDYIAREFSLERVLPDDNLPEAVELRHLTLDGERRHYIAVMRTYGSVDAADRAWELERDSAAEVMP